MQRITSAEREDPDAEDGSGGGDEDWVQDALVPCWQRECGEVGEDVEGQLGGHLVAGGVVDGDADEEEEGAVGEDVDLDVDDGRPSLRSGQGRGVLADWRRCKDCLGQRSFSGWLTGSTDSRWVLSSSRRDEFGRVAA